MGRPEIDLPLLRAAIAPAGRARERGEQPHGALLADIAGPIPLDVVNTQVSEGDFTCHRGRRAAPGGQQLLPPASRAAAHPPPREEGGVWRDGA